ncbi:hypothetical protein TNCV_652231 [Trichonephila clavipes]|nr:hypothetical protein TNCV_652231 [Trichonephila clavipes]
MLLARGIVRSVPLEIVGSSGHEKVPSRGKPGLERPGRQRGERGSKDRAASPCGPHSDSFNDTSRHWQKVVFSDESQFVLGTDDNRVRVWRRTGEQYNSSHTVRRHTARTGGVMVWGAIACDSRSTLIVMCGTLTGQR